MRRKLIDIPDDTFERLSAKASVKGENLKNYIEQLLENDSRRLAEPSIGYGYRFTLEREPTDAELMAIMEDAAIASESGRKHSEAKLFDELNNDIMSSRNGK